MAWTAEQGGRRIVNNIQHVKGRWSAGTGYWQPLLAVKLRGCIGDYAPLPYQFDQDGTISPAARWDPSLSSQLARSWDRRLAVGCRRLLAVLFIPATIMVSQRYRARGWQMPFDNPHQTPLGDLELLMEARGRISSRDTWVKGHFQREGRYCLVASLSLTCDSRSFGMPNRMELRLSRLIAMQMPSYAPFWIRYRLMPARQRLIAFNDDAHTRHDDVLALLDRTIDRLASMAPACVAA
jgi:hypothetical protein